MGIFRIIFYILLAYVLFQFARLFLTARKAAKGGFNPQNPGKKEKDISRVAKILDEKRLDEKDKTKGKKSKQ